MPSVLVIADKDDRLAGALWAAAVERGLSADWWPYREAALRFSVSRRNGAVTVDPGVPIFLRPPPAPSVWLDRESQFHHAEIVSLVWAAAALTQAPVINRPGVLGFAGRADALAAVTRRRAGVHAATLEPADAPPSDCRRTRAAVAGSRVFPIRAVNGAPDHAAETLEVCRRLELAFATVTWRWREQQGAMELESVNPRPRLDELHEAWPAIAEALLEELR